MALHSWAELWQFCHSRCVISLLGSILISPDWLQRRNISSTSTLDTAQSSSLKRNEDLYAMYDHHESEAGFLRHGWEGISSEDYAWTHFNIP
jgi:hypothetical protein